MEWGWVYCPFVGAWGRESMELMCAPGRKGTANEDTSLPVNGVFHPIIFFLKKIK